MPSTTRHQPNSQILSPPANLRLVNWPLRDDGVYAWTFVLFVVGLAVAAGVIARSSATVLLSLAIMSIAMWRMWVPVIFEFGPRGVHQTVFRSKRRIAWSAVRRCTIRKRGVLLLFSDDPSPLANALGLYIRWGEHKEQLLTIIRYYTGGRLVEDVSVNCREES